MTETVEQDTQESGEKPYDASDPTAINLARKKYSRKKANRLVVIKALMEHPGGRAWIYEFLVFCHVFNTPFIQGAPDSTAFRAGEQNIGLKLLDDVTTAAPELYMKMIKEAKSEK